jgi:hypothetical protein
LLMSSALSTNRLQIGSASEILECSPEFQT